MFSKLFGFFSLKRKFSSTEEVDIIIAENSGRPTKRVRIEEPSSTLEELTPHNSPVQDACTINDEEGEELGVLEDIIPRGTKGKEVERLEDLEEVKETKALAARLREETRSYIESIDRTKNCMVCLGLIRNPQVLSECSPTVCYPCLKSWFTKDTEDHNAAPMVSTDEESDGENTPKPGPSKATPRSRRRHGFPSAVDRRKVYSECHIVVTRRLADALNGSKSPNPSVIQPRRKLYKASKRKDLWHGIFHEQSDDKKGQRRLGGMENLEPVEGRNPIVEQAEAFRVANLEWLRWQGGMDEAREKGRRQMMRELERDQERRHEERRRQPFNLFGDQPQDQLIMRRIRGLPLPQNRALVPRSLPASVAPLSPLSSQPATIPSPAPLLPVPRLPWIPLPLSRPASQTQHNEFWSESDDLLPPLSHPIFLIPLSSEAGPSNVTRSLIISHHTPTTSTQRSSSPTILESLQQLRRQYNQSSPQPTGGDVDELDGEDVDVDLPLFSAMMMQQTPTTSYPEREYPVYAEDLNLEEDWR